MRYGLWLRASRSAPGDARGGPAERGEHWWPVALAIIVVAGLHVALPAKYRVNPPWVAPAVLLALLATLIIGDPGRIDRHKPWLRIITDMIAFITVANLFAAAQAVALCGSGPCCRAAWVQIARPAGSCHAAAPGR